MANLFDVKLKLAGSFNIVVITSSAAVEEKTVAKSMTYSACPQILSFPSEFVVNKDGVSLSEAQKTAVSPVIVPDGLHSAH